MSDNIKHVIGFGICYCLFFFGVIRVLDAPSRSDFGLKLLSAITGLAMVAGSIYIVYPFLQ